MGEILSAIKYWILYKLEIPAPEINHLDNEVQYLRNELTIAREEISRLTNLIYNTKTEIPEVIRDNDEDPEPIRAAYTPWPIKRAQLERADRLKAAELKREAEAHRVPVSINKPKIEEAIEILEEELGVKNDASRNG